MRRKGRLMRVYVRTQICKWTVGMLMFIAPAIGEPRDVAPIFSLSQLEGANIHSTLVTEIQTKQATGSEAPATAEIEWNVAFGAGGKISWSYLPVIRTGRVDQKGATIAGTSGLDEVWHTENGDAMWQFRDGELIFVQSYQGGAMRLIIALKQDGPNLGCVATNVFAREGDKGDLMINFPIDGTPITILSWKQVSSNCEVTSLATAFDGLWLTAVVCEKQGDVLAYSYRFIGRVKNGVYHGEVGEGGRPGWATYDGTIDRDGTVEIVVKGLTGGDSRYTAGHIQPGKRWSAAFAGHFEGSGGSALRVVGRTCHAEFIKQ